MTPGAARRSLEVVETGLALASTAVLFLLMLYVTAEVAMRYLFNHPLAGHLETTQLLIAPAALLSLSWLQAQRGHVGMDLLHEALPPRGRALADCVTFCVALATFAMLTWFSWEATLLAWETSDVTPTAYIATWWSKAAVPLGFGLLCVRLALQLVESAAVALGRRPG